jgi:hypothetical protein
MGWRLATFGPSWSASALSWDARNVEGLPIARFQPNKRVLETPSAFALPVHDGRSSGEEAAVNRQ